jgi:HAD superfamily hydrolase (TIGR01456 family)
VYWKTHGIVANCRFIISIDGVLLRSSTPIPGATKALRFLQEQRVPFILLTNGGGKSEEERVADLQDKLDVPLDTSLFVQSHTPFADYTQYHDKTVLVVGGNYDKCQRVAQGYGFKNVVTPGDIITANPELWPFTHVFRDYYSSFAKPLPQPIVTDPSATPVPGQNLKIDAIFVYSDPRDWGLDSAIILDTLLSHQGYIGTLSPKNGDESLPNNGYQQDGQPPLYYSNPDLWWASSYHLPRLGQGGFRNAFAGLWAATTHNSTLTQSVFGKPSQETYEFAETRLRAHRKSLYGNNVVGLNDPLRRVYMVGDNPASDIAGANGYKSPFGSRWTSVLVKTGVWQVGAEMESRPDVVKEDVYDAVMWAMEDAGRQKGMIY